MKKAKPKGKSTTRRKKLTSIPVITRRLFRLASQCCRERANDTCELCGMKKGDLHPETGKIQKVEAHHIVSRANKNSVMKFHLNNLICLCSGCHKFNLRSAHGHGLWFAEKFKSIRPNDYQWILDHTDDKVDLTDRKTLQEIEDYLRYNKDFPKNNPNV